MHPASGTGRKMPAAENANIRRSRLSGRTGAGRISVSVSSRHPPANGFAEGCQFCVPVYFFFILISCARTGSPQLYWFMYSPSKERMA